MSFLRISAVSVVLLLTTLSLSSCAGKRPVNLGITDMSFAACPSSPNCVSSDSFDTEHKIRPLEFNALPEDVWAGVREYIVAQPRSRIISETPGYIHAEFASLIFGFVDDLEIHLRADEGIIAIRSASRSGYSDFGVNRTRVEKLRTALIEQGLVR